MRIQAVQIDMEVFGAQFANMDDYEQAAFFKGLASELKLWPSLHQGEMQFCGVNLLLTDEHKKILAATVGITFHTEAK